MKGEDTLAIKLNVSNKKIDVYPLANLLRQGENNADTILMQLPPSYGDIALKELIFMMHGDSKKGTRATQILDKEINDSGVLLRWVVSKDFTAVAGDLRLILKGYLPDGDPIIKWVGGIINVYCDPEGGAYPPPVSEIEQALKEMYAVVDRAEQSAESAQQSANQAEASKKNARASELKAEQTAKAIEDEAQKVADTARAGIEAIDSAGKEAISAIQNAGEGEVNKIAAAGSTEVQRVATEGAKQVQAATEQANLAKQSAESAASKAQEFAQDRAQIAKNKEDIVGIGNRLGNIISPNLFNPAVAKTNVAISSSDGSEMDGFSGWETTDYIPVFKKDTLYFSANNKPIAFSTGAFYDGDKKTTKSFGNPSESSEITAEQDGYARFSFADKKDNLQIEKGARTSYVPYGELRLAEDVAKVQEDSVRIQKDVAKIQENHTNLFDKNAISKGAVLSENGYLDTSFETWESSDYIPVKPGMKLYFSVNQTPYGVASTGAYFDEYKNYLYPLKNEPESITIPQNTYYIRFSKNNGFGEALNTLKVEQYGITKYTPYGELYVIVAESALPNAIAPKWQNLKILTLGDSITAMGGKNGWTYWIKQYLLADKVVNVSVAGSTWQDKIPNQAYDGNPKPSTEGNVAGNQVQKVLNAKANGDADYQEFDVITFSFGTNDSIDFSAQTKESVEKQFITNYAQNNFTVVPIDNVNRQTLAGAMRYGFQKLHEAYPNAVIFMCTPTQECYETFDSIYQKGDFINFVADRCGAETIDTRRCGIRNIYESQTTIDYDHPEQSGTAPIQTDLIDGIHTNEKGAKKIAKYNAREIMKYFMVD